MAKLARRLPGFRFEVQAPALPEVLPRMDIAAFVGFAAAGPLHIPVAIEDAAQFAAIFGGDAPLAWDVQHGEQVYAQLGPAVRAFFNNGGRRAWVVRVAANTARANYFPVPGLLEAVLDDSGQISGLRPAFAPARTAGSWSDDVRVSAALLSQPLKLISLDLSNFEILAELELSSALTLTSGDLLRFSFHNENLSLLLKVNQVQASEHKRIKISGTLKNWFAPLKALEAGEDFTVKLFKPDEESGQILASVQPARFDAAKGQIILTLSSSLADAPAISTLLRLDSGTGQSWVTVQAVRAASTPGAIEVTGAATRWLPNGPVSLPSILPENLEVERLSFELWARRGENNPAKVSDLSFEKGHARFWGGLPSDEQLYGEAESEAADKYAQIWQEAAAPRFPLAGSKGTLFLPLNITGIATEFGGPVAQNETALQRDGLAEFSESLFLDPDLAGVGILDLINQADFLRYQGLNSRRLKGIHSLLGVEEVTLLAVPDAVQRGWSSFSPPPQLPPEASKLLSHPDWSRCVALDESPCTGKPDWSNFLDCGIIEIDPPQNLRFTPPEPVNSFKLAWDKVATNGVSYVLEEATRPDWIDAEVIYRGKASEYTLYSRGQGDYYYRVRAILGEASSEWSAGQAVRVSPANQYQLLVPKDYRPEVLLAVQRAALRLCAGRGDILTVLSLPEHYRETQVLQHLAALRLLSRQEEVLTSVAPLSFGETNVLSYGAIYHPWLIGRFNGILQRTSPDGVACGVMAKRAVERGAWIAPANELLPGIVALTPPVQTNYHLNLQEARLNLVRQEPRGFTVLNADTLSLDEDLRQINVRRLLILLRRMALKLGANYVFEPNDDALDRLVQGGFEAMLEQLFARGAFAGSSPAAAFQVVTSPLNLRQSREQGRFIVEIRVAPALPMTFLTLRLVQADDRGIITEVL